MGSNQNSTIVFPIPIELIRPLLAEPVPKISPASVVANRLAPRQLTRPSTWQTERRRENLELELELDLDGTPDGHSVCDVDQVAATDVAAPDPSCGFEGVFGPDWRTRYPAIAGGVDEARRQRTSPTAPADDPRRSGPPPGEQGSAFENGSSGDGWLDNPHRVDAPSRRKTVVSRRKGSAILGAPL
jgi:hypothetical protein